MFESFLQNRVHFFPGDGFRLLASLPPNSIDAVVTDPPYGLEFMGKDWDGADGFRRSLNEADASRASVFGRMSRKAPEYRTSELLQAWTERWATQCFRAMKPGAYLVSFGGTRTYHRMACAIEDAGFEIRDQIQWLYGQGFPKNRDTTLKPANEPIVLARKPLAGTLEANKALHGTGGLNIDACRVEANGRPLREVHALREDVIYAGNALAGRVDGSLQSSKAIGTTDLGRWPANVVHDGSDEVLECFPNAPGQQRYVGPEHGDRPSRGIYGDFGARPPSEPRGDEGSAARFFNSFREGEASADKRYTDEGSTNFAVLPGMRREPVEQSRFFYCAKATAKERNGSKHPTVKPVALMRWLCRLITPPGGFIIDPFGGTGTTAEAAWREGFRCMVVERDPVSQDDIRRRLGALVE